MPPGPLNVALVGYGFAGKTFHAPLIRATDSMVLAAVVSGDAAKVHADLPGVAVHPTLAALLAAGGIDLVVIATPNETHAPLARLALAAGVHVVIDKPFALDMAEARGLIAAANAAGCYLGVFHNRRWDSDFLTVRAAIEAGAIGRVAQFESRIERFRPVVRDRWRERAVPGGGLWYDLAPHLVDQALQLFGLPETVSAQIASLRDGAQTDDWFSAVLAWPGRRAVIQCSMLSAGGARRFVVDGMDGTLIKTGADRQEPQLLAGMVPGAPGWGEDPDPLVRYDAQGARHETPALAGDQRGFYAQVAATLRHGAAPQVRAIECLAVMAVIEAGQASAREGRAVPLPLTQEEIAAW